MLSLGALAFGAPWVLTALAALPVLWWLLRVTPPAPRQTTFPPLRILRELVPVQETPAHTPWWLLLLRLILAALLILALARPIWNPQAAGATGPLVLVIDDGWGAASGWDRRIEVAQSKLTEAERADRPVVLLTTAMPPGGQRTAAGLTTAAAALAVVNALQPKPWATDRAGLAAALGDLRGVDGAEIIWISDGLAVGADDAYGLAERLQRFGAVTVIAPEAVAKALPPPTADGNGLRFRLLRAAAAESETVWLKLSAEQGHMLMREPATFPAGAASVEVSVDLPGELRNRLSRAEIEPGTSAGSVVLLDERWRRRPVGLVSGASAEARQPLLSDLFYLDRALSPFTEVRVGTIQELLQRDIAVIVLADVGRVIGAERQALQDWIDRGGLLIRFAGPRLAEQGDDLLPVRLRQGGRQLGGAMSWAQPARLAPFGTDSPFAGLAVPNDVTIDKQVLAEPDMDLADRTWGQLDDGTPLVTTAKMGKGRLVLIHTSANADWSNLALSGLFVDMLRRLIALSQGVAGADGGGVLAPVALLDGFGRLGANYPAVKPIPARGFDQARATVNNPPGFYGSEDSRRALNLAVGWVELKPIPEWPPGIAVRRLREAQVSRDLAPSLLAAGLALFLIDFVLALWLRGLLRGRTSVAAVNTAILLAVIVIAAPAFAQRLDDPKTPEETVISAALDLRLAYVVTGDGSVDQMSRAGLTGLTDVLWRRTSIEAYPPLGVDLERDDISVFPFLYWPMTSTQPPLSDRALAKVDQFMKTGGLILIDTRDQAFGGSGGPGTTRLRQLLARLDLPPLIVVPPDHVLTKAFYLIQDFPGRYVGGKVWVERLGEGSNDGVSALVIGDNDWAAAWAVDATGRPLTAMVPGNERQRELAYRFGVNLIMYTLTGNYKADQVHVPALLERLGQ